MRILLLSRFSVGSFRRRGRKSYRLGQASKCRGLRGRRLAKRPGLQGPIDDAFMDRFVMVKPTGEALTEASGNWVSAQLGQALCLRLESGRVLSIHRQDRRPAVT